MIGEGKEGLIGKMKKKGATQKWNRRSRQYWYFKVYSCKKTREGKKVEGKRDREREKGNYNIIYKRITIMQGRVYLLVPWLW